jgi:gamma-glutamyltranspeptidase / glutathione hydrolase
MVATSQPLATLAGLNVIKGGGNAADAALAAAAVLCVTEPMSTGIGGDAFALIWGDGRLHGLDAAGPAPLDADPAAPVEARGPNSVTVPGAVRGWSRLAERFGTLGLDTLLGDAISAAEDGFAVGAVTAAAWQRSEAPVEFGDPPHPGRRVRLPDLGGTLRRIATEGPDVLYFGELASRIASVSWLGEQDLADFEPTWVSPLEIGYRTVTVCEMPPPTQGIAALEALGLLGLGEPTLSAQVECVQLALEDARARVRDGADVGDLLLADRLTTRRRSPSGPVAEPPGGTVYLCVVDANGMAVSFIQSLYDAFGSGVVAPETGVVLQNRGACFAVRGAVEPGRRPYHTIIPGMLLRDGELLGPFGVVGGFMQAQGHVQVVSGIVDDNLDPQAALDRSRFRVRGAEVLLEQGLWDRSTELEALGLRPVLSTDSGFFGGGQAILVEDEVLVGGSDRRKDGYVAGL